MFSLVFLVGIGFGFMLVLNNANAVLQTSLPDNLRGRVMSIYVMVFFGSQPIGSLLAGELAERAGEQLSVLVSSALLLACALIVRFRLPGLTSVR